MPEPRTVKITISDSGGKIFPDTEINVNDLVFWFNNTSQQHQPAYNGPNGVVLWGIPPNPLPPGKTSSQVSFTTKGEYSYYDELNPSQIGKITVK